MTCYRGVTMSMNSKRHLKKYFTMEYFEEEIKPLPRIEKKRVCAYPGCNTILRPTNLTKYCSIHSRLYYVAKQACKNFWNKGGEKAFEDFLREAVEENEEEEMKDLDCVEWRKILYDRYQRRKNNEV